MQRGGLTQNDARRLDYFGVVVAYPMCEVDGTFRGCLVIEGPVGSVNALTRDEVADCLHTQQRAAWLTLVAGDRQ